MASGLRRALGGTEYDRLLVITDSNVHRLVWPRLKAACPELLGTASVIVIPAGERNKNLNTLASIWSAMNDAGATRRSLVVNLGGGVVTDIGGFAAATYKRGLDFINVPTTLLGAADAAVGGKTGIDFEEIKNGIGVFADARAVVLSSEPFDTLPADQMASGYAEILKMAMLTGSDIYRRMLALPFPPAREDLLPLLEMAVRRKAEIVTADPRESGERRQLNLGHTAGHAFESLLALRRDCAATVSHGTAVAHGLLVTLILSHLHAGLDSALIHEYVANFLKPNYPRLNTSCSDTDRLMELMLHDKKNVGTDTLITFVLLEDPGHPVYTRLAPSAVRAALDTYLELMA